MAQKLGTVIALLACLSVVYALEYANGLGCGYFKDDHLEPGLFAKLDSFPWSALLVYTDSTNGTTKLLCGGVLLDAEYVLTATQCVTNLPKNYKLTHVRLGEWQLNTDPDCESYEEYDFCAASYEELPIKRVIVNPSYKGSPQHNLALIQLEDTVVLSNYIAPVCLPTADDLKTLRYTQQEYAIPGWGAHMGAVQLQNEKHRIQIRRPFNITNCNSEQQTMPLNDTALCVKGTDTVMSLLCNADVGAGLVWQLSTKHYNYFLAGVHSLRPDGDCTKQQQPYIFTKIEQHLNWINEIIN